MKWLTDQFYPSKRPKTLILNKDYQIVDDPDVGPYVRVLLGVYQDVCYRYCWSYLTFEHESCILHFETEIISSPFVLTHDANFHHFAGDVLSSHMLENKDFYDAAGSGDSSTVDLF